MKKLNFQRFGFALLAAITIISCNKEKDNEFEIGDGTPVSDEIRNLLDSAIYIPVEDEKQPAWLQSLIEKEPYTKVFRSENSGGLYLVEASLKGDGAHIFTQKGKQLAMSSETQLLQTVRDGLPWTLTHIYSYPLKPGGAEWDFTRYTPDDIKKMLQLPTNLCSNMPTLDLAEVCWDYYYSLDFLMFENLQFGIEKLRQQFNGYEELLGRKDLAKALLKKYDAKLRTAEVIGNEDEYTQGSYSICFTLLKMLVAQDEMLDQLSREQLCYLIEMTVKADKLIPLMPDVFSQIHKEVSLFLYSRIILREGGFEFVSEDERLKVEYYAETCTSDMEVILVFTPDLQERIYSYFKTNLGVVL